MSFNNGVVPDKLKLAKVIPLYKKDKADNIENYRPIALLSIFDKLLEKLMFKRLYYFLTNFDILIPEQFGFRQNYSTSMSVIHFSDYIFKQMEIGKLCCGIFMDLSKAFDTIDHRILLKKLSVYGIRGLPLQWFHNYLSERKQYVMVDGVESTNLNVNIGVPQGSVLGPLLFLIYVNDIIKSSQLLKFSLFADDTVVIYSHNNIDTLMSVMNNELQLLNTWFKCNKLYLNFSKTKCIFFHSRNKKLNFANIIKIEDTCIERTSEINFLGVKIHETLDWKYHINNIITKLSRSIGVLSKLKKYVPLNILKYIYNAIILPHLNYCNEIWGNSYKVHLDKLYILQKRAVRIITSSNFNERSSPLFVKLRTLPLYDLVNLNVLMFMFKFHNGLLPSIFNDMFRTNAQTHNYNTRNSNNLCQPLSRLTSRKQTLRFTGVKEWNSVCNDLRLSKTSSRFKKVYKEQCFKRLSSFTD